MSVAQGRLITSNILFIGVDVHKDNARSDMVGGAAMLVYAPAAQLFLPLPIHQVFARIVDDGHREPEDISDFEFGYVNGMSGL